MVAFLMFIETSQHHTLMALVNVVIFNLTEAEDALRMAASFRACQFGLDLFSLHQLRLL